MKLFKRRVRISPIAGDLRPINALYWSLVKFLEFFCYFSILSVCYYLSLDYETNFPDDPMPGWWYLFPALSGAPAFIVLFSKPYSRGFGFREQGGNIKRANSQQIDGNNDSID